MNWEIGVITLKNGSHLTLTRYNGSHLTLTRYNYWQLVCDSHSTVGNIEHFSSCNRLLALSEVSYCSVSDVNFFSYVMLLIARHQRKLLFLNILKKFIRRPAWLGTQKTDTQNQSARHVEKQLERFNFVLNYSNRACIYFWSVLMQTFY